MGVTDEHWCSDCKKKLDKTKDEYIDFELIHLKGLPNKKGLICKECLQKPEYDALRKLLGAGNPDFLPFLECGLHAVCGTFKPVKGRAVRCGHLAVIGDTIYCKRKHPGSLKLIIEKSEKERLDREVGMKFIRRALRGLPPELAKPTLNLFEDGAKKLWNPPSGAITQAAPIMRQDGQVR